MKASLRCSLPKSFMAILLSACLITGLMPVNAYSSTSNNFNPYVEYSAKKSGSSKFGFRASKGKVSGTAKPSSSLKGIKLSLSGLGEASGSISYKADFIRTGWSKKKSNGESLSGKSKNGRIQAIKVYLSGDVSKKFNVYYRVYSKSYGWMGWARNGTSAGTKGLKQAIGAYQVRLVAKGSKAPGSIKGAYKTKLSTKQLLKAAKAISGSGLKKVNTNFSFSKPSVKRLKKAIKSITRRGNALAFAMIDINTGQGVFYNGSRSIYSASTLKGPYVAAVNKYYPNSISSSSRSLMYSTVKWSSNEAYASVHSRYGTAPMRKLHSFVGGCSFSSGRKYDYVTPQDMAKLWIGVYDYFFVNPNKRTSWCKRIFSNPSGSLIRVAFKGKYTTYSKYGWYSGMSKHYPHRSLNARNDCGIVMSKSGPYILASLSTATGGDVQLKALYKAIDKVHTDMVNR